MPEHCLVVGGSGFIGSHVADALSESGYKVTILDYERAPWIRDDQRYCDPRAADDLEAILTEIDYVFYFAGIADIEQSRMSLSQTVKSNIYDLTVFLEKIRNTTCKRFIYASTMYVFSDKGSYYRATKQSAEILIQAFFEGSRTDFTFIRYGSVYGPRAQNWNGITKYVQQAVKNKRIQYVGTGNELREYIHVIDAARLTLKVVDTSYANKAVTLTGQQAHTMDSIFRMIFEIIGKNPVVDYIGTVKSDHYEITPYKYSPIPSVKLVPSEYHDLGHGIMSEVEKSTA